MAKVIALSQSKGGVGKTTTTANIGVQLAQQSSVLLVDLDPQSNLTGALGVVVADDEPTVYEALNSPTAIPANVIRETAFGVHLLPATLNFAGAEQTLANRYMRELLLKTALQYARTLYDYILIDCPPSLGFYTANALSAADVVLVPVQAQPLALKAVGQLDTTVQIVQQLNPALHIGGVLLTMTNHTLISREVEAAARDAYGELVFAATIPLNTKLAEAPAVGQPIHVYAPQSAGAVAYAALAQEVRQRWPVL